MFALITFEPVGHPEQRAEEDGAIIAGQIYYTGFNNEAAQFDQVPRALAALDLRIVLSVSGDGEMIVARPAQCCDVVRTAWDGVIPPENFSREGAWIRRW